MCGINGFTFRDSEALRRMHDITKHRGPDDEGFFESDTCSLAHNRLSIIDLSSEGRQPMKTPDGRYVISFNGEIYNYREIRRELETLGETFRSESDTEVLVRAWSIWGEAVLARLNGMFAFAIWDLEQEELTLVRDHAGIKPLYYRVKNEALLFSSSMKALRSLDDQAGIDPVSLNLYFRFLYVPSPRTIISGIQKLPRGHLLRFKKGQIQIVEWHKIEEGQPFTNRAEARTLLRETLSDAVNLQLVSDRPLGVFLSGGIDSTALLGLMRERVPGTIKTFSIGYEATEEAGKYNADFELAKRTADYFQAEHHPIVLSGRDIVDAFPTVIRAMDEPVSNHIQPSTYFLAKYAREEIVVALGGDGADELFGGYSRYWLSARIDQLRKIPASLRPAWLFQMLRKTGLEQKMSTTHDVNRFLSFMGQKAGDVQPLFNPGVFKEDVAREIFAPYFEPAWSDFTNQLMAVDAQTWLPDESLVRSDKLTMAHGLEQRVPFLDPRLFQIAYRIPSAWKLDTRELGKQILREALQDVLPAYLYNEKKRGFFSPAAKWLRDDMLLFAREVLSDGYGEDAYINLSAVRRMLDQHVSKQGYFLNQIWSVLTYRVWMREVGKG